MDNFQALLENQTTSKLFTPYISKLKVVNQDARRTVKKRIEHKRIKVTVRTDNNLENEDNPSIIDDNEDDEIEPLFASDDEQETEITMNPSVGEYWKVKNGVHCLFAVIVNESPSLEVRYFAPTMKGKDHCLNDTIFQLFKEDLYEKLPTPKIVKKGRRTYYNFE